jgi:hypothetical protein
MQVNTNGRQVRLAPCMCAVSFGGWARITRASASIANIAAPTITSDKNRPLFEASITSQIEVLNS